VEELPVEIAQSQDEEPIIRSEVNEGEPVQVDKVGLDLEQGEDNLGFSSLGNS
jgi:hypothetical protein